MIRPRGVPESGVIVPKGCSMVSHVDHVLAARVIEAKRQQQLAQDAEVNAAAPVTLGTRTWL